MITPDERRRYFAHRATGQSTRTFRRRLPPTLDFASVRATWFGRDTEVRRATVTRGPLTFVVSVGDDDDAVDERIEFYGAFVPTGTWPETLAAPRQQRWRPTFSIHGRAKMWHDAGMAKGPAYAQAVSDTQAELRHVLAYGAAWNFVGVGVEMAYNGVPLDAAALWGIESCDKDYIVDVAFELIDTLEAEAEAARMRELERLGQLRLALGGT